MSCEKPWTIIAGEKSGSQTVTRSFGNLRNSPAADFIGRAIDEAHYGVEGLRSLVDLVVKAGWFTSHHMKQFVQIISTSGFYIASYSSEEREFL